MSDDEFRRALRAQALGQQAEWHALAIARQRERDRVEKAGAWIATAHRLVWLFAAVVLLVAAAVR
jgi:hypothetical protein